MSSSFTLDFSSFDDIGSSLNAKKNSVDLLPPEVPLPTTLLAALDKQQEKDSKVEGPSLSESIVANLSPNAPTGIKKLVKDEDHVDLSAAVKGTTSYSYFEDTAATVEPVPAVVPLSPSSSANPGYAKAKGVGLFGFMQRKKSVHDVVIQEEETIDSFFGRTSSPVPAASNTTTAAATTTTTSAVSGLKGIMLNRSRSKSKTRTSGDGNNNNDSASHSSTPPPSTSTNHRLENVTNAFSSFMTKSKSKQPPQQQRKNSLTPVSTTTTHEEPTAPGKTSMSISTLMRGRSQRQDSLEATTTSTLSRSESTTSRPPASGTTPIPPIRTKSKLPSFSAAASASKKDSASAASAAAEPLSIAEIDMTLDMLRSPSLKRKITNKQSAASLHSRTSNGSLKGNVGTNNGVANNNGGGVAVVAPPVIPSLGEVAMDMLRTATAKRPNRTSFNEALRGEPGLAESGHAWFLSPGVKRNEDGSAAAGSSTLSRVGE